jgi:hypothetical protein
MRTPGESYLPSQRDHTGTRLGSLDGWSDGHVVASDGRWVLALAPCRAYGWLGALLLLAAAIAIGAPPSCPAHHRPARHCKRVDALGAGNLTARVQVEGCDGVAELARSFVIGGDRVERLMSAQKGPALAGASHEAYARR